MSNQNARVIEKDAFAASGLGPTQGGDSEVVDLFGSSGGSTRYSCQLVYDVLAFSAAVCASATDVFDKDDPDHPSQFKKVGHGLVTGLKVQVATSSALPTPLLVLTDYFVIKVDDDYFQLASSLSNALAGTEIELDDAGTGNQTVTAVALAGASAKVQKSNDRVNWVDVAAATSISSDGSAFVEASPVSYRYVKAVKAITSGAVGLKALILAIGDAQ